MDHLRNTYEVNKSESKLAWPSGRDNSKNQLKALLARAGYSNPIYRTNLSNNQFIAICELQNWTTRYQIHGKNGGGVKAIDGDSGSNGGWNNLAHHYIIEVGGEGDSRDDITIGYEDITSGDIEGISDYGSIFGSESITSEIPILSVEATQRKIDENHGVAPFLIKLYKIVDDEETHSIISWGSACNTFIIFDENRFVTEILPSYFKTGRFDAFISQLNNYVSIRNMIEPLTKKLISTFSHGVGRKRKFVDIDPIIDLVEIEKDLESMYDQFEVSNSDIDGLTTLNDLTEKVANVQGCRGGEACRRGEGRRVPPFLHKLYNMVEKQEIDDLISWNLPYRYSFIIWDTNKFATHVLPAYFSHANFGSFHSQLNIYGFKKVCWERHEYANEWFLGGRGDLLSNITRREKNRPLIGPAITFSLMEIEIFMNRFKAIQQEQDSKIIWLSYYEEEMKISVNEFKEMVINIANIGNKMISKSNENLDNAKIGKLVIEDNGIGSANGQNFEVDEVGEHNASKDNNNIEAQSSFQGLQIDLEVVTFPERPELKTAVLNQQPFLLKRETLKSRPLHMVLLVNFSEGCGCRFISIDLPVDFEGSADDISQDKNFVIQQLRDKANEDRYCGQSSLVDRKVMSDCGKTISTYAVATNIIQYDVSELTEKVSGDPEKVKLENGIDVSTDSMPAKKLRVH
nr:winged helix-turn-helix DNA-binding domain, heat shock transcription factor family [Tanacetum cinerariifolium]